MSAIQCNCTIEATLDACSARLQARAREYAGAFTTPPMGAAAAAAALGGRVPSWLHMPGPSVGMMLGAPSSAGRSWGDGMSEHEDHIGVRVYACVFVVGGMMAYLEREDHM
jgi:hypothetical protein